MITEPSLYVNEKSGSDEKGKGTKEAPFATPVGAYFSLSPATASDKDPLSVCNILVSKAAEDGSIEWTELSGAGKKKLVKGVESQRKKLAKLAADGERLEKERAENEAKQKKLREEAITISEDPSKPAAKLVSEHKCEGGKRNKQGFVGCSHSSMCALR